MKTLFANVLFYFFIISVPTVVSGQFDDLYFTPGKDVLPAFAERKVVYSQPYTTSDQGYYEEYDDVAYSDEYYDDYDYSYTNRIRRFHSPVRAINYYSFNNWYDDFYYDPFFPNNNINVFIGSPFIRPWGWNSWNVGWGWNSWGPGWGWNSWNRPWGWNTWNSWNVGWGWNSWGWNSWNSPWGWNSCPSVWNVNNNFYGNNWNNWHGSNNWNNGNNTIYSSRRGGSTGSSTRGINASPRREVAGGVPEQTGKVPDTQTNDNHTVIPSTSRSGADRSKIYRGDIKNPETDAVRDNTNTTNVTRSSIYRRPETQRNDSGRVSDRTNDGTVTPNVNRNNPRGNTSGSDANRNNSARQSPAQSVNPSPSRPSNDNSRQAPTRSSSGGFDSGSSPRSTGGSMNSGSSRSSSGGSMNSGGGSSRSSSGGGGSRRGG